MSIPLFLCLGFFTAVCYMDLVFDVSALPYRKSKSGLPKEILDPIVTYYAYVTKNPWLLVFCLITAATSVGAQVLFHQIRPAFAYASAVLIGTILLFTVIRVVPAAQRLASRKETEDKQASLVHGLFPSHIVILILILSLAFLQFQALRP